MSRKLKIITFLAITFFMIGFASAVQTINLTTSNVAEFDGKIDIGVVYDNTTNNISVQFISTDTSYIPLGIDKFFYNLNNNIISVSGNSSEWETNFDGKQADGFGKFESKKSQDPGGTDGILSPLVFTLDGSFDEPIPQNSHNSTIAIHIRFSEDKSAWVSDGLAAAIDIEKSTNGEDADDPTGPVVPVGSTVTWIYNVTNIGDFNLTNINVTDSVLGVLDPIANLVSKGNGDDILEPGEFWIYNATGTAAEGQYANLGNVTGDYNDLEVNDTDPSHYFGEEEGVPSIDIEKFTEGVDADDPTGPELIIGDNVEWTYMVTNNGTATLTNITVVDDKGVTVICPFDTLAPGEWMNCTATGTVGEGQYSNNATVTAKFGDIEVNDTDPSHYFGTAGGEEPIPTANVLITAGLLGIVIALFLKREK